MSNFRHHEAHRYEVNKSYLVFAYGEKDKLATGICSGTSGVEYSQKEIKALGKWKRQRRIGNFTQEIHCANTDTKIFAVARRLGAGQPVFYFGPLFRLFHGKRSAERLDRAEKRDGAMVRMGIALAADHSR